MKKVIILVSFLTLGVVLLFVSCPLAVTPASGDKTTLIVRFSVPRAVEPDSRAVLGPGGFLYIRTLGGPAGERGPAYGPYNLSGGTVTITDIPTGSYSNMVFLHSTSDLSGSKLTFDGTEMTFEQVTGLSDQEYIELVLNAGPDEGFSVLVDGLGSEGKTGPITIVPGPNEIALTLVPLYSMERVVAMNRIGSMYYGNYSREGNRFIRIDFVPDPEDWQSLQFNVSSEDPAASLVLYNRSGSVISGFSFDSDILAFSGTAPASDLPLYLYLGTVPASVAFFAAEESMDLITPRLQALHVNSIAVSPAVSPTVFSYSVTVPNTDSSAIIEAAGVNPAYPIVYNPASTIPTLPFGATSVTMNVTNAATEQSQSYTLSIIREEDPNISVSIVGYGSVFSGQTLFLGEYPLGTETTRTITVNNTGLGPLRMTNALSGSGMEYYSIVPAGATLPPSTSEDFTLTFISPGSPPNYAQLRISSNDPDESEFLLDLSDTYC